MPRYVLTYFNIRGRAEPIRLLFHAAGVEFEDKRLTSEEWAVMKTSGKAPFGQLPLLEVDGTVLAQSFSIMRYVANEVGLAPSTNLQKAQADMIVDGCADLASKLIAPRFEKDEAKKAELVEQAKAATSTHLKFLEDILATNNGGKGFFVGDKLSHADIAMFNLLNYAFAQGKQVVPDEVKHFPLLAGHCDRIMNIPNIKKWLEERPETAG